jgi:hypothetical protein
MTEITIAIDCEDVEPCIEASPTITTINNNITTIEGDVTNVSNTVNNHTTELTELNESVTELYENAVYNEFPPEPVWLEEPDQYCGAAWAVAEYLNDFIQDVITDAQTITFAEFITAILGLGGFKAGIVKLLWDYVIASINPNLSTEASDSIAEVAEHFYCNNLIVDLAKADIEASTTMTADAIALYVGAIDSLTVSKFSELIYIGSLDETADCDGFCYDDTWCYREAYYLDQVTQFEIIEGSFDNSRPQPYVGFHNTGGDVNWNRGRLTASFPSTYIASVNVLWTQEVGYFGNRIWFDVDGVNVADAPDNNYTRNINAYITSFSVMTQARANFGGTHPPSQWIRQITINGRGLNPFGVDNC